MKGPSVECPAKISAAESDLPLQEASGLKGRGRIWLCLEARLHPAETEGRLAHTDYIAKRTNPKGLVGWMRKERLDSEGSGWTVA